MTLMESAIKRMPVARRVLRYLAERGQGSAFASADYWQQRYAGGGTSGAGSYGRLAEFKARILNEFVSQNDVQHVIELGCGDGNQLRFARYPSYSGYDVAPAAVERCRQIFADDPTKSFHPMTGYRGETADLSLSLDVIFHLVEDEVFEQYMKTLFASSTRFVVIYSTCRDEPPTNHERHRVFTRWIDKNAPEWELIRFRKNDFPLVEDKKEESFCDFYFFGRRENTCHTAELLG